MNKYVTVEIPARTAKQIVSTHCDRCGVELPFQVFGIREVSVSCKTGSHYPDSDIDWDHESWEIPDICDACGAVMKALLQEAGFKISQITD